MKSVLSSFILGVALIVAAANTYALSLGRAHSVALLGRPLELRVGVRFDPGEAISGLCFSADIFYGDVKLEASQVTVASQMSDQQNEANVQIVSRVGIDEPVVTVYVRAGCGQQTTRRYVVLADLVSEVALPVAISRFPRSSVEVPHPMATALPMPIPASALAQLEPDNSAGIARPAAVPRASTKVPTVLGTVTVNSARSTGILKYPLSRLSKLKLVPLDFAQERSPTLKLSMELSTVPAEDLKKRVEVRATWRSLNTTVQEILRDDARLLALDNDLKTHKDMASRTALSLQELSSRLEQVEAKKNASPIVVGLIALVVAMGLGLTYAWSKLRGRKEPGSAWWSGESGDGEAVDLNEARAILRREMVVPCRSDVVSKEESIGVEFASSTAMGAAVAEVDIDLSMGLSVPAGLDKSLVAGTAQLPRQAFSNGAMDGLRSMNMQEMLDVRQQAEFFMTLGQYDEAIQLLAGSIKDSGDSNPLVCLDLIKALHTLSRKSEYDDYRHDFNTRFSGYIPEFSRFNNGGASLDSYSTVIHRISALWPSQEALNFIEHCLVRPVDSSMEVFELSAFRDLLTLHGVASRILSGSESGPAPFSTAKVDLDLAGPNERDFSVRGFVPDTTQSIDVQPLLATSSIEAARPYQSLGKVV